MMMIVDICKAKKSMSEMTDDLSRLGEEIGVSIKCQNEDIFDKMHRI